MDTPAFTYFYPMHKKEKSEPEIAVQTNQYAFVRFREETCRTFLDFKISKYLRKSLKYKTRYGRIVAI